MTVSLTPEMEAPAGTKAPRSRPFEPAALAIEPGRRVLIKPNAVHFSPQTYTDPGVLESLLAYLIDHGFTELGVMENVTGGNFSRLVFRAIGYTRICKRYGAKPIFLDEGPTAAVRLRGEEVETRIPQRLHDDLIRHRRDSFYLSLPTLIGFRECRGLRFDLHEWHLPRGYSVAPRPIAWFNAV